MKRNDIVITSENVKKRSCLFKGILIKTTALSGTSSQTCTKVAFLHFFIKFIFLCMQHLVKFLQNWSRLKTDAVFLSVSFIRAEQFLLQAQLGCGHVFSWQALSQKADWLIEAVETKFIGFDPVNPEGRHTNTHRPTHTHIEGSTTTTCKLPPIQYITFWALGLTMAFV